MTTAISDTSFFPAFPHLSKLSSELAEKLIKEKITVAAAESLTGGFLSASLTSVAGSSKYFLAGITAYSNDAKTSLLGVSSETIRRHGAVSRQCATEMAVGVKNRLGSVLGLSTTGIAGPDGGSAEKPVGLVYVSVAGDETTLCKEFIFKGNRLEITLQAAFEALRLLSEALSSPIKPGGL
jgi:PncC family amidohydrolase